MSSIPSRQMRRSVLTCALTAALLALPVQRLAAQSSDSLSTVYPSGAHRGEAAIEALGDQLTTLAEANDLTADELAEQFRNDSSLWVDSAGNLFFVDIPLYRAPGTQPSAQSSAQNNSSNASSYSSSDAFMLHTNPGANQVIYMDFDGHLSVNNSWGHNITFPAYNTNGSAGTFSTSELNEIITWWLYVAEDFSSFDVDITTEEPPLSSLTKNGGGDQFWGVRAVITQPTSGFGNGTGGIAIVNSFDDSIDNPCFVFNKGNNTGSMTVGHEVGHTLGLSHDGLNGQSYHPGTGTGETSWGPIMGAPFGKSLVQWSKGEYAGATTTQNDLQIIVKSANGIGFLSDDHGDDETAASPIGPPVGCPTPGPGTATGVIERKSDVDAFFFTTSGGLVTVSATPTSPGGNLDIKMDLLDSAGIPIVSVNDANEADAITTQTLTAGTYYVLVDGIGKTGVYTDYGCLGQYTVAVILPGQQAVTNLGGGVADSAGLTPLLQIMGTPCAGNSMTFNLFLAENNAAAWLFLGVAELSAPFKGGILVPDASPPGGLIPMTTNLLGAILINTTWPAGLPPGLELYIQYWIQDASGPFGFTASDGLKLYAP